MSEHPLWGHFDRRACVASSRPPWFLFPAGVVGRWGAPSRFRGGRGDALAREDYPHGPAPYHQEEAQNEILFSPVKTGAGIVPESPAHGSGFPSVGSCSKVPCPGVL